MRFFRNSPKVMIGMVLLGCAACVSAETKVAARKAQAPTEDITTAALRVSVQNASRVRVTAVGSGQVLLDARWRKTTSNRVSITVTNVDGTVSVVGAPDRALVATNTLFDRLPAGWYAVDVEYDLKFVDLAKYHSKPSKPGMATYHTYYTEVEDARTNHGRIIPARARYVYRLYAGLEESCVFPPNPHAMWGVFMLGGTSLPTGPVKTEFISTNDVLAGLATNTDWVGRDIVQYTQSAGPRRVSNWSALTHRLERVANPVVQGADALLSHRSADRSRIFGIWGEDYSRDDVKYMRTFSRVKGSDLHFTALRVPTDAFIEYAISTRLAANNTVFNIMADPLNSYCKNIDDIGKGTAFLVMPERVPEFTALFPRECYTSGMRVVTGERLLTESFVATNLGARSAWVYLPPSYGKDPARRYPVVYAMDGQMYYKFPIARILDSIVVTTGKEFIFVMLEGSWQKRAFELSPDPEFLRRLFAPQLAPEDDARLAQAYETWVTAEVVPRIDARYRTVADRAGRVIMGSSFGGNKAGAFVLRYPGIFGKLLAQSGLFVKPLARLRAPLDVKAWISYGIYDLNWVLDVVGGFTRHPANLARVFRESRVHVFNGGHKPWLWIPDLQRAVGYLLD